MKNKDRSGKRLTIFFVAAFFAVCAVSYAGVLFTRVTSRMNNSANESLMTSSYMIKEGIEEKIEKDEEVLNTFSDLLSSGDTEKLERSLQAYKHASSFFELIYLDMSGHGIDSSGREIWASELPFNEIALSQMQTGVSFAYPGNSGRLQITYQSPVVRDGEQIGAIYGKKILSDYNSPSLFSFHKGNGRSFVIDSRSGKWLIEGRGVKESSDIFEYLEIQGNEASVQEVLKELILEGKSGTVTINFEGRDSLLSFLPINILKESYLISIIPKDVLQMEASSVINMIRSMLVLLLAAGIFIVFLLMGRQAMRANAAQKEYREKLFRNLSANIDFAFLLYTPSKRSIELVSDNMEGILGIGLGEIKSPEEIFDCCGMKTEDQDRTDFLNGKLDSQKVRECRIGSGNNELKRWVAVHLIPADYGQYLLVLNETTKEHHMRENLAEALEQARSVSEAKTTFFSSMSHDIRTPMNGIMGMTNIALANLENTEKVKTCLEKIMTASSHLLSLINDVLDMSRIESGKISLKEEEVHLPSLISNILEFIRPELKRKSQEFQMKSLVLEHDTIISDSLHLQKILLNLLSNAVKYTPEGGKVCLRIGEKPGERDTVQMCFQVEDNGIGMSPEFLKKIFLPFEREEDNRKTKVTGTGLGMAIVKSIVDLMGGDITVESKENKGSKFTVTLPLKCVVDDNGEVPDFKGHAVLVADDDQNACESIGLMLNETGLAVNSVFRAQEAVEKVRTAHERGEDYSAVLLDWKMPDMDGLEAARQIRAEVGEQVFILLISAYDWENVEQEAAGSGINDFLTKPVFKSQLLDKLRGSIQSTPKEREELQELQISAKNLELTGMKILIAEDNDLNREIITEIMAGCGAKTVSAENGREAVQLFVESTPGEYQMVFMDVHMPKMDGLEATRKIRESGHPDALHIPVIAMTADIFQEDVKKCMRAGMNAHIGKPIELDKLFEVVEHFGKNDAK